MQLTPEVVHQGYVFPTNFETDSQQMQIPTRRFITPCLALNTLLRVALMTQSWRQLQ